MPAPTPHPRRRVLLAAAGLGGGLVLGASGCGQTRAGAPAAQGDDADAALVDDVRAVLSLAHAQVAAVRAAAAPLRRPLRPLLRLHALHADELGGLLDSVSLDDGPSLPDGGPEALRAWVVARERATEQRLTTAAIEAESGALAQLLAAMVAGTAQHRTELGGGAS